MSPQRHWLSQSRFDQLPVVRFARRAFEDRKEKLGCGQYLKSEMTALRRRQEEYCADHISVRTAIQIVWRLPRLASLARTMCVLTSNPQPESRLVKAGSGAADQTARTPPGTKARRADRSPVSR